MAERKPEIAFYFRTWIGDAACPFEVHQYTRRTREDRTVYYYVVKLPVECRGEVENKRAEDYLFRFFPDLRVLDYRWWDGYDNDSWENSEHMGDVMC